MVFPREKQRGLLGFSAWACRLWGRDIQVCLTAAAFTVRPWASQLVSGPVSASLQWDDSENLRVVIGTQSVIPDKYLVQRCVEGVQ